MTIIHTGILVLVLFHVNLSVVCKCLLFFVDDSRLPKASMYSITSSRLFKFFLVKSVEMK